ISSFKIESSGYGSKKNLDSILKVNIGTGKKRWQKIPPGLPQTERIIQAMVKMDSTSTVAMKALNRFQKRNSNWKAKPQNSIFGPGC
ncbi:probable cation-transporting atpase, partial [Lynx pardinus]